MGDDSESATAIIEHSVLVPTAAPVWRYTTVPDVIGWTLWSCDRVGVQRVARGSRGVNVFMVFSERGGAAPEGPGVR